MTGKRKPPAKPKRGPGRGPDTRKLPASFGVPPKTRKRPAKDVEASAARPPEGAGASKDAEWLSALDRTGIPAVHDFGDIDLVKIDGRYRLVPLNSSVAYPRRDVELLFPQISALVDAIMDAAKRAGEPLSERKAISQALDYMPEDWKTEVTGDNHPEPAMERRIRIWRSPSQRAKRALRSKRLGQDTPLADTD